MRNQQGKLTKDVQSLCIVSVLGAAIAISASAQTIPTVIHRFSSTNGESPWSPPLEGVDLYFYGTTSEGGVYQNGTIYKLNPEGKQDWVYPFYCEASGCPYGSTPLAGMIQGTDLWLYGTTWLGGANSAGTVFQIQTEGKNLLAIHSFCAETSCGDGAQPMSTMVAGYDGIEYGTTAYGSEGGYGTIFGIEGVGKRDAWYGGGIFCLLPNCADGYTPEGPLIQASDGNIYGTTESGGAYGFGAVFSYYPPAAELGAIYSFCQSSGCPDGGSPAAGVIEGADGNFYGVTANHGVTSTGGAGEGVVFQLTPQGVLTVLHTFTGADGHGPVGLLQATDGNLYGLTQLGGAHNKGTIFEVTTGGTFTKLYDFAGYGEPHGGLIQKTDGNLYGAASVGGSTNSLVAQGVIFRYDTGLSPFVKLLPALCMAGAKIIPIYIYGPNLTGATAVLFNGVPSTNFTIDFPTMITADVPAGATSGPVTVVTPSGTLTSNVSFSVLQP